MDHQTSNNSTSVISTPNIDAVTATATTAEEWFALGVRFIASQNFPEAEFSFRQAVAVAPNSLETLLNLGYVLNQQGQNEDALQCYTSVLAIFPNCAEAHYNRATQLLLKGDYKTGFADYEYRLTAMKEIDTRVYSQPLWDGSPLNGRTILIFCEQGLGDAIMFARFIPFVAKLGGQVLLEVQQPLLSLLSSVSGVGQVIEKTSALPVTDCYIQLLSLPHLFKTTLNSVPCQIPYITAPAKLLVSWKDKINKVARDTFQIGLVWAGKELPYPNRSCPLSFFEPLSKLDGITLFSLQIGDKERFSLTKDFLDKIIDLTADINDFADTAALISNLDLVISIDSAVAHLAGALGKAVWVMLPHAADWRWLDNRSDSPWYPTMRLFRQQTAGDWNWVVAEIILALQELLPQTRAKPANLDLTDIQTCYDLGVRLKESGDFVASEECFRQIVNIAPALPDPQYALGVVLQLQGKILEAIPYYQAATVLDPQFAKAHYNLADALSRSGCYREAFLSVRAAIKIEPKYQEAHWLLGMLLLKHGDYTNGWTEYEWRWKCPKFTSKIPDLGCPLWDGSPLDGRTLLIHMEQGRGDMIQFVRYVPMTVATGGSVIICSVPELVSLLSSIDGVSLSVDRNKPLPDFDLHIPALSLPFVFKTTLETIPNNVPYIFSDALETAKWHNKISSTGALKVGFTWAGQDYPDPKRTISFSDCLPLFSISNVDIYSLQFGKATEELSSIPPKYSIIDYTDLISDFADTAALVANLDLVITIDTAVAHLAGAMGKTVWILLPYVADWRWLLERSDTPWYPTMKIFRQTANGDWRDVIDLVKTELLLAEGGVFLNRRGIELLSSGETAEAELLLLKARTLYPTNSEILCNLGIAQDTQHKYEEAINSYRDAISFRSDYMEAYFNMGNSFRSINSTEAAISCYERSLLLSPNFLPALLCLGELCKEQGKFIQAEKYFAAATRIEPHNIYGWQGLGDSQHGQEHFAEAIFSYKQTLAIEPTQASSYNKIGLSYHHAGRFDLAGDSFRKALSLNPDDPAILNNLGTLLHSQDRIDEEIAVYRRLLGLDLNFVEGHWNLSLALLTKGEFVEGWMEYEWRFKKMNPVPIRDFPQLRWDGSHLEGKTILLHCEQGFGDTIQFARYAPLVAQRGGNVVLECQSIILKRLLASLAGIKVVVSGDPLPHFDCHLPLLSLPLIFNTTVESIPAPVSYLSPNRDDVETWRRRLGPAKTFRVGIAWFARQDQILNRKRSCQLKEFSILADVPNCEFFNLQVGIGTEQLSEGLFGDRVIDFTANLHDFADTAAFMKNLDLVITIDTAAAHLAGALGIKTWTILPFGAEWRWLQNRLDSPWYPTMRLFRQSVLGEWKGVMHDIHEALVSVVLKPKL